VALVSSPWLSITVLAGVSAIAVFRPRIPGAPRRARHGLRLDAANITAMLGGTRSSVTACLATRC
jgi:hypothetical protein